MQEKLMNFEAVKSESESAYWMCMACPCNIFTRSTILHG